MKWKISALSLLLVVGSEVFTAAQDAALRLSLQLLPESKWSSPRIPKIKFTLTNTSSYSMYSDCLTKNKLYLFTADGSLAPLTPEGKNYWDWMNQKNIPKTTACVSTTLAAGETTSHESDELARYYELTESETYTVYDEVEESGVFVAKSNRVEFAIR
jgi:hypothetical protein